MDLRNRQPRLRPRQAQPDRGAYQDRRLERPGCREFPHRLFHGTLGGFRDGAPTRVEGELTLRGVTRPLSLRIESFKCIPDHPIVKREVCGADALGAFNRADFGINTGAQYGFRQEVTLRIQVEAIRQEP